MAQKHNSYEEKPMTRYGTIQGPSRRYRRLRHPSFPAAEWTAKNPLLQRGEIGFEIDTHKAKVGDGTTYWNDLPYSFVAETEWGYIIGDIADQTDLKNALDAKQDVLTAGTNINITGNTISAIDTTYTGSDGITLTGTNFTNSGVRSVASGTTNGTISVNTGGTSADVSVTGLGSAAYTNSTDYATASQGAKADTAVQPADLSSYVTKDTTQTITGEKTFSGIMNYSAGKTYILAGNGGTKLGYWSYDIDGQSNITLQTMTASTRNINFKTNNGGKVTYNGSEIAKVSDLPSVMTGATAGDAGTSGLVPAPAAGDQGKFLQGDGSWANPTATTAWGNITGTLSDQTDLKNALDGKQDTLTAGTNINITGSTISATDTTYTGSDGVTLTGTNFTNSGVRSVSSGTTNGTISVNTNGTSADVSVTGLGSAAYTSSSDYATSAQGTLADTAVQPGDLATVATTGDYDDLLNKPTIPAAQVNSDWNTVSGVAQILNKPTTLSGYGITDGANTDLSNLTSTGQNIGNWSSNVSNCITEIPQDIKLELNAGTLTLKAGSKVYVPNGAGVFDIRDITADQTYTQATNGQYLLFVRQDMSIWADLTSNITSGTTPPAGTGTFYNTTTNSIDWYSGGIYNERHYSFPFALITVSNGAITSINQVFNGFGYIGSTVFALPGVKGLAPNGRNTDGSLYNNTVSVTSVITAQIGAYDTYVVLSNSALYFYGYNVTVYLKDENRLYDTYASVYVPTDRFIAGQLTQTSGVVKSFTPKTTFRALDYNDSEYIANCAMPSKKNISLTVGASGTQYTAPADGYFLVRATAPAAGKYLELICSGSLDSLVHSGGSNIDLSIFVPVSKGFTVTLYYTTNTPSLMRFIYDNGSI